MTVQVGLCRTRSETPKTGFLASRLILFKQRPDQPAQNLLALWYTAPFVGNYIDLHYTALVLHIFSVRQSGL